MRGSEKTSQPRRHLPLLHRYPADVLNFGIEAKKAEATSMPLSYARIRVLSPVSG